MADLGPEAVFRMHLQALSGRIETLGRAVAAPGPGPGAPGRDELLGGLRPRFEAMLQSLSDDVAGVDREVGRPGAAERRAWADLRRLDADTDRVSAELLRCLQGALIRHQGIDDGLIDVSDALLHRLGRQADVRWPRHTILASGDLLAGLTDAIGARFPGLDVWSLPVVVHEFGHFVAPRLRDARQRETLLEGLLEDVQRRVEEALDGRIEDAVTRERTIQAERSHFHEFFADLFATFALGPAYACCTLLLRFDPALAHESTASHPSDAARSETVLQMLEAMDRQRFRAVVARLRRTWAGSVRAATGREPRGDAPAAAGVVDTILPALRRNLPAAVQYRGWAASRRLARELASDVPPGEIPLDGATLADVLNAAWLARLEQADPAATATAGARATALLRDLARRAADGGG